MRLISHVMFLLLFYTFLPFLKLRAVTVLAIFTLMMHIYIHTYIYVLSLKLIAHYNIQFVNFTKNVQDSVAHNTIDHRNLKGPEPPAALLPVPKFQRFYILIFLKFWV